MGDFVSRRLAVALVAISGFGLFQSAIAARTDAADQSAASVTSSDVRVQRGAIESKPFAPTIIEVDLRTLPPVKGWQPGDPIKEVPQRRRHNPKIQHPGEPANKVPFQRDPLLEKQERVFDEPSRVFTTPTLNFQGQGFSGVNPPDTVGEVGQNYYIQMINGGGGALVTVYDKTDGTLVAGPFSLEDFGEDQCASGLGDPILLYDALAQRWMLSEFSSAGNRLCVYVSITSDPIAGGWYNYDFEAPGFPDYPKYGIWPDAYYVSSNESSPAAYAFDRERMLNGEPATAQRFTAPNLAGFGFQALQPADHDGFSPPPANEPGIFMRHRDDEAHNAASNDPTKDFLEIFEFDVDWDNPDNSTFTGPIAIDIAEIDSELCGFFAFACMDQPSGGTTLDPLREVVMWRLQYRNFGSHEALIGNLVTDIDGNDVGGIRWFELRRNGGAGWQLFQEGTYSLDTDDRWMGSISQDSAGNIALAYSVSGAGTFPAIRYTGRLGSDAPGVMTQAETSLIEGTGSNNSNRWGDYSSMNVDPIDDCTFWHTNEFSLAGGQWSTQIGSFRFDACGEPGFTLSASALSPTVCAGVTADPIPINIGQIQDYTGSVMLSLAGEPAGVNATFDPNPVTPPSATTATISIADTVASGEYVFSILGTAPKADNRELGVALDVTNGVPSVPALMAPADGAIDQSNQPIFEWAASEQVDTYTLELDDDPAFGSIDYSVEVTSTSHLAGALLEANTTFYWRVRGANICGDSVNSPVFAFTVGNISCDVYTPDDLPIEIPNNQQVTIDSIVNVAGSGTVIDVDVVGLRGVHTWINDLSFELTSPAGTTVEVLERDCGASDNFDLSLDDSATTTAPCPRTGGGTHQPTSPLAAFNEENGNGAWTMSLIDHVQFDGGLFEGWGLQICAVLGEAQDSDGDSVIDTEDNCINAFNPSQCDSDGDNYGNHCDGDLTNSGNHVNYGDLALFIAELGTESGEPEFSVADLDCSGGVVNMEDLNRFRELFNKPPGPSGLVTR